MGYENNINVAPATSSLILEERHNPELFCVYTLILDDITDHLLLPNRRLAESEPCRQMVCSRNAVHGALSLLAYDRIVDLQPNRDAFAHVPDLKEMRDVFNMRIEMESMILSVLIDMPDLETRLQPLYTVIEQEDVVSGSSDCVGWNRLSNASHVELARLLDNGVLFEIMNTLCVRSSLIVAVSDPFRKERCTINSNSHHEYREILNLLMVGKHGHVTKVVHRHLSACTERLEQKLEM